MPVILHHKPQIEAFLQQDVYLNIYSLGDLDDFFWPYTIWYGREVAGALKAIALLYTGLELPNLLALSSDLDALTALLESTLHLLPRQFYSHLSPGIEPIIATQYNLEPHGQYYKMKLQDVDSLAQIDVSSVVRLSPADFPAIRALYNVAYPGNWFDPRMLETNHYFGIKMGAEVISIAGVHVYSAAYKVAALGNITTHPDHRGRGLGSAVTARLCQVLRESVDHIGLNVRADNEWAIRVYQQLGFVVAGTYNEYMIEAK